MVISFCYCKANKDVCIRGEKENKETNGLYIEHVTKYQGLYGAAEKVSQMLTNGVTAFSQPYNHSLTLQFRKLRLEYAIWL